MKKDWSKVDLVTYHPVTRERRRGYLVIVGSDRGKTVAESKKTMYYERKDGGHYPYLDGYEAIDIMESLKKRGFDTVAYTNGFGIEENLSLDEMLEVVI